MASDLEVLIFVQTPSHLAGKTPQCLLGVSAQWSQEAIIISEQSMAQSSAKKEVIEYIKKKVNVEVNRNSADEDYLHLPLVTKGSWWSQTLTHNNSDKLCLQ